MLWAISDGYNFQQLKSEILSRSRADDWEIATTEWYLVGVSEGETPETCLCSHFPIIELCTIANRITKIHVDVGNVCVKRYLGFRSDLIFASINGSGRISLKAWVPKRPSFFMSKASSMPGNMAFSKAR
jgi:hypothetical protein